MDWADAMPTAARAETRTDLAYMVIKYLFILRLLFSGKSDYSSCEIVTLHRRRCLLKSADVWTREEEIQSHDAVI